MTFQMLSALPRLIPDWLRTYPRRLLADDLTAGLIVAVLALPQSLAYALLAGLPPQVGLYVSILPAIAYAWVGSSAVQAVGPVAITSIMTYTVLSPLAVPGSPQYIQFAACLALMSGLLLMGASVLRLGFLAQLLSRPVTQGFISGSAILIVISQARHLFGLEHNGDLPALFHHLSSGDIPPAAAIGLACLAMLVFTRNSLGRLLKGLGIGAGKAAFVVRLMPLVVVAGAALAVHQFDLAARGVATVGSIQSGLPGLVWFVPDTGMLTTLALPAGIMALVGMVQNIAMAQALAIQRREKVDANREILGLGAANLFASMHGGMPVGGGVSRSALNVAAGARSPLASIVSGLGMAIIVLLAAPSFASLPLAALAATIMVAAFAMIDLDSLRTAWRYDRVDALSWLGTAGGVVFIGLEAGIALGIALSLAALLVRASTPHIARLGRLPGSEHFRNVERHAVETLPHALFLRIDESLFFGNLAAVEEHLAEQLARSPEVRHVVLVMSAVNRVDTSAMETLRDINRNLAERGLRLHFAEIKGPVQDRLQGSPLLPELSGLVFLSANAAFESLAQPTGENTTCA
jgi:SulP family sulfate permease